MDFELEPLALGAPDESKHVIKYALIQVGGDAIFAPQWAPQPRAVMPFPRPFGYSSRLDDEQAELEKIRTIKKGYITMYPDEFKLKRQTKRLFWSGNLPYEYNQQDFNGQQVVGNKKLFLVLRGTTKIAGAQKPTVACVIKVGYRDS